MTDEPRVNEAAPSADTNAAVRKQEVAMGLTPGTWHVEPQGEQEDEDEDREERAGFIYIDMSHVSPDSISRLVVADWATDEDLALMAAAKDLLAACRAALEDLQWPELESMLRAAIAKAGAA